MRKSYIEFIRIIACILIIIPHIDTWDNPLFSCLRIYGVPIFAMIAGYVIFINNIKYVELLKRTFFKIIIPVFILTITVIIFNDYIYNISTLYKCIKNINIIKIIIYIPSILTFKFYSISKSLSHLWYIYQYVFFIAIYPLIIFLYKKKHNSLYFIIIIAILSILSIINDISLFNNHSPIFFTYKYSPKIIIFFLIGCILYINKDFIFKYKKISIIASIILILIGSFLKFLYLKYISSSYSTDINTFGCLTSSIGAFILLLKIGRLFNNNKIINFIASKTYIIYLIHYPIIEKIKPTIWKILNNYKRAVIPKLLCTILVFILMFIIATIISYTISSSTKKIKKYITS